MTTTNPFDLTGKVAVVTGAARGLGRAIAVALAGSGADVVGVDLAGPASTHVEFAPATPEDLVATGELVEALGRRWSGVVADTRDLRRLRAVAEQVTAEFGGLDVLVANAGIQAFRPILEMTDPDWHDQIDVNLTGAANTLRAFGPLLVDRGAGRVIVTSSTQGQHGTLHGAAYSASKWGLIGLAKSAALEWGRHGVTVNVLVPGLVDTALTRHEDRYAQAIADGGGTPTGEPSADEATAAHGLAGRLPLGVPWIEPADIAPAVVYLASDAARMTTGTILAVTGGDSARLPA